MCEETNRKGAAVLSSSSPSIVEAPTGCCTLLFTSPSRRDRVQLLQRNRSKLVCGTLSFTTFFPCHISAKLIDKHSHLIRRSSNLRKHRVRADYVLFFSGDIEI